MSNRERFIFAADAASGDGTPVEMTDTNGSRTLKGYAVVWGAVSTPDGNGIRYQFDRDSIQWTPEVLALWHHAYSAPLASTGNGTLRIAPDDKGVKVEIDLADTTAGRDTFENVKSRLVKGMSFGGYRIEDVQTLRPDVRKVTKFIGDEVSITAAPRMVETSVEVAAMVEDQQSEEEKSAARKKEASHAAQKLNAYKLHLLRPGRVSGTAGS